MAEGLCASHVRTCQQGRLLHCRRLFHCVYCTISLTNECLGHPKSSEGLLLLYSWFLWRRLLTFLCWRLIHMRVVAVDRMLAVAPVAHVLFH